VPSAWSTGGGGRVSLVKLGAGVVVGEGVDDVFDVPPDPVDGAAKKKVACHQCLMSLILLSLSMFHR
jgi:hypothetical protein